MGDGPVDPSPSGHKVLLIRHGETVDNVKGLYAGVRDSALTSHGVLQASKLGEHLGRNYPSFTHIFSSTLSRAFKTAEAIRSGQPDRDDVLAVVPLDILKEQDFGYFEGKSFHVRSAGSTKSGKDEDRDKHEGEAAFRDIESKESMAKRADAFLDQHLMPLLVKASAQDPLTIAIVSHGILLSSLWKCILKKQNPATVSVVADVLADRGSVPLEHIGGWSNTGYLELDYQAIREDDDGPGPTTADAQPHSFKINVKAVNEKEHLKGLKRTRGGVGSAVHDQGQKTLDSFFRKQKTS